MDINLIQTKPNEYAYLNDINLTVIETNSDALCPPDSAIKEIISKEGKLIFLNKELKKTNKLKKDVKTNIIFHEILNILVYGSSAILYGVFCIPIAGIVTVPLIPTVIYFLLFKSLLLVACGTRIGKYKKLKKLKNHIKLDEKNIEEYKKNIEELKNEIGYKVALQISREEYERKCRIIELERNNKLPNTKYKLNNDVITLEKYMKIGQKKRR